MYPNEELDDLRDAAGRLRSLLVELWDGVRDYGLKAPDKGKEGERLIHAYCGGIATLRIKLEEAENIIADKNKTIAALKDVLVWASGASDFAPGGKAHESWKKMSAGMLETPSSEPWTDTNVLDSIIESKKNLEWIRKNAYDFSGLHVALKDGELIESASTASDLQVLVGNKKVFIAYIPPR